MSHMSVLTDAELDVVCGGTVNIGIGDGGNGGNGGNGGATGAAVQNAFIIRSNLSTNNSSANGGNGGNGGSGSVRVFVR